MPCSCLFHTPDDDGNGTVELSEFLGMKTCKMGEKDPREDTEKIFKLFDEWDTSGEKELDYMELATKLRAR